MLFSLKNPGLPFAFLPLIVLGGFLYHLLFEAKSLYILPYFVMLVPYAAYGLYRLVHFRPAGLGKLFRRRERNGTAKVE